MHTRGVRSRFTDSSLIRILQCELRTFAAAYATTQSPCTVFEGKGGGAGKIRGYAPAEVPKESAENVQGVQTFLSSDLKHRCEIVP